MESQTLKKSVLLLLLVIFPLSFSDCDKEEAKTSDELCVIDVSAETDWDYWVIAKDGGNFFIQQENFKPVSIYYQPDKDQDGFTLFFNEFGLPSKGVINDHIILFENIRKDLVDAAVISPSGEISIFKDVPIEHDLTQFQLDGKGLTGKKELFNLASLTLGVVSCVTAIILPNPFTALACGAAVVNLAMEYFDEEVEAISASSTVAGTFVDAVGCITGDKFECIIGAASVGTSIAYEASEDIEEDRNVIEDAVGSLIGTKLKDIDGNYYDVVEIGIQTWMAENLKVTRYNDGTSIPNVNDKITWADLTTGAYCDYNNDANNGKIFGHLYNFYVVTNLKKVCPAGWHAPSDDEWKTLEMYLGMTQQQANIKYAERGTNEGGKLKEKGTTHWLAPNTGATNSSGFTALPGMYVNERGDHATPAFHGGFWWTSTSSQTKLGCYRGLHYDNSTVWSSFTNYTMGFSLRCVKD